MAGPFSLSTATELFKKKYLKYQQNVANGSNAALGVIKRDNESFVGEELQRAVDMGWIGGAGAGVIPTANRGNYSRATLSSKSLYITAEIDRRSMKQSKDAGAFVEGQKHMVQKTTEKYQWLESFCLWGSGDGAIGTITGSVTDNGSGSYSFAFASSGFVPAKVEVRDIVNIESGDTSQFEITAFTSSTRTVTVQRISGSQVPATSDEVFLQGAEDAVPEGIPGVVKANSGSKYGISVAGRWMSYQKAASSAGLTVDMLNEVMLGVHEACGKSPSHLFVPYTQMRVLLNQLEDKKEFMVNGKTNSRYGEFSFNSLIFHSVDGPVPIIVERFLPSDEVYAINADYVERFYTPDSPGWVDDDTGSIWLRKAGEDKFEARYASYGNTLITPIYHGVITGLAT